jgi:hypothetical protein
MQVNAPEDVSNHELCGCGDSTCQSGTCVDMCLSSPPINCTAYYSNFVTANATCFAYGGSTPSTCIGSTCSSNPAQCANVPSRRNVATCGSALCMAPGVCVAGNPITSAPVCIVNASASGCPTVTCATTLSGWAGAACQRYSANLTGYCNSLSACSNSVADCTQQPGQSYANVTVCDDKNCNIAGACLTGSPTSSVTTACYVNASSPACTLVGGAAGCSNTLSGWVNNTCSRYTVNSTGVLRSLVVLRIHVCVHRLLRRQQQVSGSVLGFAHASDDAAVRVQRGLHHKQYVSA